MLIDLKLGGKYIVVVGGGAEGYRKILNFVDSGAKIVVMSKTFSSALKKLQRTNKVSLLETTVANAENFVNSLNPKPDLLVAVTNDHELNSKLVKHAKAAGCIVYAADNPAISDFVLPAIAKVGEVRIAISTSGKSPAMARALRQRIEKTITEEDSLQIELQTYARTFLKQRVSDHKTRRLLLYKVIRNKQILQLLKEGKSDEAQKITLQLIENWIKTSIGKGNSTAINLDLQET
ncbi:MAG: bifunctional precorrin-2 dehydrogenase/sirohydrochlorin ferrochelatase [Candidatus Bathyarchaeota archaeon]|nr:bifunctional precorrin-2 dehydrogenase/sirohydrochlorin ferrochelatase [Candidatus Bathyarchaeota archaeon]